MGDIAEVHQGIEYLRPLEEARHELISESPRPGLVAGVHRAQDILPYRIVRRSYLCSKPEELRRAKKFPWSDPKVIVNAARRRRGRWSIVATADHEGLWCYQRLFGIWPVDSSEWPLDLVAAVLNGPVANAFASTRANKRDIQRRIWIAIPMPMRSRMDVPRILDLVSQTRRSPDLDKILHLDAEILRGYDLPPRVERDLLRRFEGEDRPGIEDFYSYYPANFASALPLHQILGDLRDRYRASRLVEEVPVLHEPRVSKMFDNLLAGYDA